MGWLRAFERCGFWLRKGILSVTCTGVLGQFVDGQEGTKSSTIPESGGSAVVDGVEVARSLRESVVTVPHACVVVGAEGEPVYGAMFRTWASRWGKALGIPESKWIRAEEESETKDVTSLSDKFPSDRERVRLWIEQTKRIEADQTRWLVLLGHGTYDGRSAKFNLRGEDLSATQLQEWLGGDSSPWIIVVSAASSGPFLKALSGPNRVVVVSTKSGSEGNFSRFGEYMSASLSDIAADLDHDGSISVLEAFLVGARKTQSYYADQGLLATEHALLEDNSDGVGSSHEYFRGIRPTGQSKQGRIDLEKLDGAFAKRVRIPGLDTRTGLLEADLVRVSELEQKIEALRGEKGELSEEIYYERLEVLLLEMARLLYPDN